jgi:hypothetical protein
MKAFGHFVVLVLIIALSSACAEEETGPQLCDMEAPSCKEGFQCAEILGGEPTCLLPVELRGQVQNLASGAGVSHAQVQLLDENGVPMDAALETDGSGIFVIILEVPRDLEGGPAEGSFGFIVQAPGYEASVSMIRPPVFVDASQATLEMDEETEEGIVWVVEPAVGTLGLIPLAAAASTYGTITGKVRGDDCQDVLVAAEGEDQGVTTLSDSDCEYTLLNVLPGNYTVSAFQAGTQYQSAELSLAAGLKAEAVDLLVSDLPLAKVSGKVELNPSIEGQDTSVALVLESTWAAAAGRGVVPEGLTVVGINGSFVIEDVPDGRYVVMPAYGIDGLVMAPDQTQGGTRMVTIEIPDKGSRNIELLEALRVNAALSIEGPGADGPEAVKSATPIFMWGDDAGEAGFELVVVNSLGEKIWDTDVEPENTSETAQIIYAGPTLKKGMYYQFRVQSYKDQMSSRVYLRGTEELRGVFFLAD